AALEPASGDEADSGLKQINESLMVQIEAMKGRISESEKIIIEQEEQIAMLRGEAVTESSSAIRVELPPIAMKAKVEPEELETTAAPVDLQKLIAQGGGAVPVIPKPVPEKQERKVAALTPGKEEK